jgi:hypothetical protein
MTPLIISVLVLAGMVKCSAGMAKDSSPSKRIGDLVLNVVSVETNDPEVNSDHYLVRVRLRALNMGKQALCVGFVSTITASFSLQYRGYLPAKNGFQVSELLPHEEIEGDFEFRVKSGEPGEIVLKPTSDSQTCVRGKDSLLSIWHSSDEIRFSLSGLPTHSPSDRRATPPQLEPGTEPQAATIKAFQGQCPDVRITTSREQAHYFVELSPASLKQSKNTVRVVSRGDDLIYSGATFTLKNAAKDACTAILTD